MVEIERFKRDGFAIVEGVLDDRTVRDLLDALAEVETGEGVREKRGARYAVRDLCARVPRVAAVAASPAVRTIVEPVVGGTARVVRSLLFDKTAGANWKVAWHQDLSIAVKERREADGFGPWSVKAGVVHVQPPVSVLEDMLTVRIHLDDCGESNGALRVVPGSHRLGVLDAAGITTARQDRGETTCTIPRGGAVVMRPLTLHASSPATAAGHRRVIHLEFAAGDLPRGLEWTNP